MKSFNQFNEGLRDKMVGKSKEELEEKFGNLIQKHVGKYYKCKGNDINEIVYRIYKVIDIDYNSTFGIVECVLERLDSKLIENIDHKVFEQIYNEVDLEVYIKSVELTINQSKNAIEKYKKELKNNDN